MSKSNSKQKRVKKTQERETSNLPLDSLLGKLNYSLWRVEIYSLGGEKHSLWQIETYSLGD